VELSMKIIVLGLVVIFIGILGAFLSELVPWIINDGIVNWLSMSLTEKLLSLTFVGAALIIVGCFVAIATGD
jgi:hypothetical protein